MQDGGAAAECGQVHLCLLEHVQEARKKIPEEEKMKRREFRGKS